jgi:hypothetical protein
MLPRGSTRDTNLVAVKPSIAGSDDCSPGKHSSEAAGLPSGARFCCRPEGIVARSRRDSYHPGRSSRPVVCRLAVPALTVFGVSCVRDASGIAYSSDCTRERTLDRLAVRPILAADAQDNFLPEP